MTNLRWLLTTTALIAAFPLAAQTPAEPAPAAGSPATEGASPAAPAEATVATTPAVDSDVVLFPVDKLVALDTAATGRILDVQSVPRAVSVFSPEDYRLRGPGSVVPLVNLVPNAFASPGIGIGAANSLYIRGLGSNETGPTNEPAVGTFLDGIYLRQNANDFGMFDIARVDVLRGPQGVLLGRNTTGGAIDVTLQRPGDKLAGNFEAGYGSDRRYLVRGSIDLPASAAISVKLSGYYDDDRGYVKNRVSGQRQNDSDRAGLRGAVQFKIAGSLTWNVAAAYMRDSSDNLLNFDCGGADDCSGRFAATPLRKSYPTVADASPFVALGVTGDKAARGLGQKTSTQLYTSHLDWDLGGATLSAITGFVDVSQRATIDLQDRGAAGYVVLSDASHNQFSQDLRLAGTLMGDRVDYVVGASYYDDKGDTDFADVAAGSVRADRRIHDDTEAKSAYIQLGYGITDALRLSGGVRYTDEDRSIRVRDNRGACQGAVLAACLDDANLFAGSISRSRDFWTPSASLTFAASDAVTLFASASRAYRSGGWDVRAVTPAALRPYADERVWSYEGGARTQFLGDRLRVNLTGFYMDGSDVQAIGAFNDTAPVTADFRNYGAEVEVTAVPIKGLSLFGNLGYQNARYRGLNIVDAAGDRADPVRTPKLTAAFGGSYDYAIPPAGIILQPSISAVYRSKAETGVTNLTTLFGGSRADSVVLVSGALTVKTDDGNWTLGIECANCLDEEYTESSVLGTSYLAAPRSWLVRARRVF